MTALPGGAAVLAASFAVAGFVIGLCYFALLHRSVALYSRPGSAGRAILLTLLRLAAATGFFVLTARHGAGSLLASFVGFLGARTLTLRRARNAP